MIAINRKVQFVDSLECYLSKSIPIVYQCNSSFHLIKSIKWYVKTLFRGVHVNVLLKLYENHLNLERRLFEDTIQYDINVIRFITGFFKIHMKLI